jgi:hypothetical protein
VFADLCMDSPSVKCKIVITIQLHLVSFLVGSVMLDVLDFCVAILVLFYRLVSCVLNVVSFSGLSVLAY